MSNAVDMYVDNRVDAFIIFTSAPNAPALGLLSRTTDVKLLSIADDARAALESEHGYGPSTISMSVYPEIMDSDVNTISSTVVLISSTDVSENEIYHVTRAFVENLDYIHGLMERLEGMSPETMPQGVAIDLHPGAEKYYREIGAIN